MKMPKKKIQKWIDALRSGKYKQGMYSLQGPNGYCCLGVACELFAPTYRRDYLGYLEGGMPNLPSGAPEWLAAINHDFMRRGDPSGLTALVNLNDNDIMVDGTHFTNFTFDEIADLLQAVYILEVLK